MPHDTFDFIVIGGGSGGVRAARRASSLGQKTLLFEQGQMGGTCVLRGCIPKKLMVYGSDFPNQVKLAQEYGWSVKDYQLDWIFQKQRRDLELTRLSKIYQSLLDQSGVQVIYQKATLSKKTHSVIADGKTYKAPHILIATGGVPYKPKIPGVEHTLVSDDIFQLQKKPRSLVIIGAGYIALEFAGIFKSLGCKVSLLYRGSQVLRGFDQDARSFFQKQASLKGLEIITQFQLDKIVPSKNGFQVCSQNQKSVEAEQVLIATGRRPSIHHLNLKEAGVQVNDQGAIEVSKNFQTSVQGVYAIGDCASTPFQLTPVALAEAEVLVKNLFQNEKIEMDYNFIPSAVFSSPPLAVVGMSEEQALQKGHKIQVFESTFRPLKYTINPNKTEEKIYIKLIVDDSTDQILGCHIVGEDSPEIIQAVAISMKAGATKKDFDNTLGLHPSTAEELCSLRSPRS